MSGEAEESASGASAASPPARGRIDRFGRLAEADPPLAALHEAAGGEQGGVLVAPQLAAIVGLARRLGVTVARPAVAATDMHDVHLLVRASPMGEDVELVIEQWRESPVYQPPLAEDAGRRHDALRACADWTWETDDALRLTTLDGAPLSEPGLGGSLTAVLKLVPDEGGGLPLLDALGGHRAFSGQRAQAHADGAEYRLSAEPLFDGKGRFRGFRGIASASPDDAADASPAGGFGRQVDGSLRRSLGRIVDGADAIQAQAHGALRRDYAGYAANIAGAGRHLLGLIDDLVDLETVERGGFTVDIAPIDLADVARRAIALLAAAAKARHIRIGGPGDDDRAAALGDDRRVLQIAVNLLGNAVRYAPEHSEVWVRVEASEGIAALVVADQGRGIAAADHARIFDKFDRLGADEPGGSGLGLYIARRLARMMDGDIAVDSAPGQGARFTLALPTR